MALQRVVDKENWNNRRKCPVPEKLEDAVVQFCRKKAFKGRYSNMWIEPRYFDDRYLYFTSDFFAKVRVDLYPKLSKVPEQGDMSDEMYRAMVWDIAHNDIRKNKDNGVKPIGVVVIGVRYPNKRIKGGYGEKIESIAEV